VGTDLHVDLGDALVQMSQESRLRARLCQSGHGAQGRRLRGGQVTSHLASTVRVTRSVFVNRCKKEKIRILLPNFDFKLSVL